MEKICGIHNNVFWVCEFNEYTLNTLLKVTPAFDANGEFVKEVKQQVKYFPIVNFGTPLDVACNQKNNQRINNFLTPEKQEQIKNLFKKND